MSIVEQVTSPKPIKYINEAVTGQDTLKFRVLKNFAQFSKNQILFHNPSIPGGKRYSVQGNPNIMPVHSDQIITIDPDTKTITYADWVKPLYDIHEQQREKVKPHLDEKTYDKIKQLFKSLDILLVPNQIDGRSD